MKIKFDFKKFLYSFIIAFIVNIVVVNLWNLFFQGDFNLGLSFIIALVIGAVLGFYGER